MLGTWHARKALAIETHLLLPLTSSSSNENANISHCVKTTILILTLEFSGIDKESPPFFNTQADQSLLELLATKPKKTIYQYLEETVDAMEIDCNINDPPMAFEAVVLLLRLLGLPLSTLF